MADLFSREQLSTLRALVDRVIPADEYPSGWEAGVGDYLLHQLERGDLRRLVNTYRAGLTALDAESCAALGVHFDQADTAAQDSLLARLEKASVETVWPVNPAQFFTLVIEHCMEGYYSDPGNGGNRGGVSWKMIGFEVRG